LSFSYKILNAHSVDDGASLSYRIGLFK
jgi:hypothetical protein